MAKDQDKDRELPQTTPPSGPSDSSTGPDASKDPDVYDPVGMAGKKAGIVQEIEQELKAPTEEEGSNAMEEKGKIGKTRT